MMRLDLFSTTLTLVLFIFCDITYSQITFDTGNWVPGRKRAEDTKGNFSICTKVNWEEMNYLISLIKVSTNQTIIKMYK